MGEDRRQGERAARLTRERVLSGGAAAGVARPRSAPRGAACGPADWPRAPSRPSPR